MDLTKILGQALLVLLLEVLLAAFQEADAGLVRTLGARPAAARHAQDDGGEGFNVVLGQCECLDF